jgi:hypothetical protein
MACRTEKRPGDGTNQRPGQNNVPHYARKDLLTTFLKPKRMREAPITGRHVVRRAGAGNRAGGQSRGRSDGDCRFQLGIEQRFDFISAAMPFLIERVPSYEAYGQMSIQEINNFRFLRTRQIHHLHRAVLRPITAACLHFARRTRSLAALDPDYRSHTSRVFRRTFQPDAQSRFRRNALAPLRTYSRPPLP